MPNTVPHGKFQVPLLAGELQVLRRVELSDSWFDELLPMVVPRCVAGIVFMEHCLPNSWHCLGQTFVGSHE